MKTIYLASPYTNWDKSIIEIRYKQVLFAVSQLRNKYLFVYSPIVYNHQLAIEYNLPTTYDYWKNQDMLMIEKMDLFGILTLDGWVASKGIHQEEKYALKLGKKKILIDFRSLV